MKQRQLSLLLELLSQPTAPFREQRVVDFVSQTLQAYKIPFFADPIGNLVVGCRSQREYRARLAKRSNEPLRVYIAHMDHPGFHGVRWLSDKRLQVKWHGGGPTRHTNGAAVWLADDNGGTYRGIMRAAKLASHGYAIDLAEVHFEKPIAAKRRADSFYGGFSFRKPVWRSGDRLYTKAADDLVGVYAVIMTAIAAQRRNALSSFVGLLTRAEEVGFIGAIGHFELGWLARAQRHPVCISLETSRTLPGAIVGKGPVVRLGDRRTVFEPAALNVLTRVAQRVLPKQHQRRIMDGGTCEATAATVYGFDAIGISIPLGNYHNQGLEGGPDCRGANGPAPEFVHLNDIEGMLALCQGLMLRNLPWSNAWKEERSTYGKRLKSFRRLLT